MKNLKIQLALLVEKMAQPQLLAVLLEDMKRERELRALIAMAL